MAPPPPAPAFSLWRWLRGLLAPEPGSAPPSRRPAPVTAEQEDRVIAEFCRHFGLRFRDTTVLKLALTHRSYLSVTGQGPRESNERLEFLGDSVLGLVTSEYLYRRHPTEHEGQLTKTKSLLVSKAILSRRALAMGLGRFVLMSHSEVESGGRQRLSILADAFESVLGAIYLDQGFEASREFIERWLLRESEAIVSDKRHTNYKSGLQEFVQSNFRTHPVYRIRSEAGPDHSKHFIVEVMVGRRVLGEGRGHNKKEAEQAAARNALERVEADGTRSVRERRVRERPDERERTAGRERPAARARVEEREPPAAAGRAPAPGAEPEAARAPRRARRDAGPRDAAADAAADAARPEPRRRRAGGTRIALPPTDGRFERLREEMLSAAAEPEVVELEPAGSVEEDEHEEVGRPEGTLEERHVDVYDLAEPVPAGFEARPEEAGTRAGGAEPVEIDDLEEAAAAEAAAASDAEPEPAATRPAGARSGRAEGGGSYGRRRSRRAGRP